MLLVSGSILGIYSDHLFPDVISFYLPMIRFQWFLFLVLLPGLPVSAQSSEVPSSVLNLQNLNEFTPTGRNWKLAGDVFYDLNKAGKGSLKPGTGILVNDLSGKSNGHITTKMEHGDIELDLDFMMDKGSNAGVYLQGRYEIQLFDSWGVKNPTSADCGAIYERWDDSRPEGRKGYEGHAPAQNVSKAPGLWQHLTVVFRAPRFNPAGTKIQNARFEKVMLNGVTIHENIDVTGPTRAAAFQDEQPTGPLMIQGDHGPVAIRNIRYKAYGTEPATLTNLKLSAYEGKFKSPADLNSMTPRREMAIDVLAHLAPGNKDNFGGKITGLLHLPRSGQYLISLNFAWIPAETNPANPNGAGELTIGGKTIGIDGRNGGTASAIVNLEAGDHPVVLTYYKNFGLWYARSNDITLAVEGPGVAYTALAAPVRVEDPVGAITLQTEGEPIMQRGFVNHRGRKHTHTISVGEPGAANYTVDLQKGELLQIWRGGFLETTPMWYGRGETQLSVPLGSVIELSGKPSLAVMTDQHSVWPDSNATYNNLGYDVDPAGRPVFKYTLGSVNVRESFEPEDGGRKLAHRFIVTSAGQAPGEIWCRVAEGRDITELPNGLYAINDKQYFIELPTNQKPVIRSTARNTKELRLPVKGKDNGGL